MSELVCLDVRRKRIVPICYRLPLYLSWARSSDYRRTARRSCGSCTRLAFRVRVYRP